MENIFISDLKKLEELKRKFIISGKDKLRVISDFDRTISKAFVDGEKIPSIISQLRKGNFLTENYRKKANELYDKYHPIEINPNLSKIEKAKFMHEWWKTHYDLLIKLGLNKNDIERVVKEGKIKLREGVLELFYILNKYNIPLLILSSSGLGDAIPLYFKKENCLYKNIYVISNFFEFDKNGTVIRIKEPIIHSMNKNEIVIKDYPIFELIKSRKNIILIGDTIEDIEMAECLDYDNIIKIGYLNENIEENLEIYKKFYDVIILNDSDMSFINELVKEILR